MKKLYDFCFCEDAILTRDVIFYLVKVGTSKRDQDALRYIKKAVGQNAWIALHDAQAYSFIEKCALSLFPGRTSFKAVALLRRKMVEVTWLATFLRNCPGALLNSLRIPTGKPLI